MAIDVRATVSCSLGEVISGSVSDSPVQGAGLVFCSGSIKIKGTLRPVPGTPVSISYSKPRAGGTILRQLLVISSFADPFRKITTVELGCKLTYMRNKRETPVWTAFDDPNNSFNQADAKKVIVPISASAVAAKCLSEIGLSGSVALTSKFSVEKFDFSPGYVQVLNDLLVSESLCGYVSAGGGFQTFALNQGGGAGPGLDETNIIDISGIGVGEPPGEAITVSYSSRKPSPTKENDNNGNIDNGAEATKKRNWEKTETTDVPTTVYISNPFYPAAPVSNPTETIRTKPPFFEYNYIPRTESISTYDSWDRLIERKTTTYTILADIAPLYVVSLVGINESYAPNKGADAPGAGSLEYTIESLTTFEYEVPAPSGSTAKEKPTDGTFEIIKKQTITVKEPFVKLAASTPIYQSAKENNVNFSYRSSNSDKFVASKAEVTFDTQYDPQGAQITKTLTKSYVCYGYTQRGQQYMAEKFANSVFWESVPAAPGTLQSNGNAEPILERLSELTPQGTSEEITTGRELNLQRRPGPGAGSLQKTSKDTEQQVAVGSSETQSGIKFNMPYAPDDTYAKQGDGSYKLVASDAPQKAQLFGQVQNRLLLGFRSGVSVQTAPEYLPSDPFSIIVISANGVGGAYRTSGNTWTFDGNGIIGAVDALFWGGVGG